MSDDLSRLSDKERKALVAYRDVLLRQIPGQLRRLILYGSRARGDAAADSDLDVAVILAGHDQRLPDGRRPAPFGDPVWQAIVDAACDVSLDHDILPFAGRLDRGSVGRAIGFHPVSPIRGGRGMASELEQARFCVR